MDVEGKKTFHSQYIKDEEGRLVLNKTLIRERWVRWFRKLLSTTPTTLDLSIVGELENWPQCRPLDDVPGRYGVEEAIRALANRTSVGPDGFPAELLKVSADKRKLDAHEKFHDINVAVWRGGGASQRWKYTTIKVLHKYERSDGVWQLSWHLRGTRWQNTPQIVAGGLSDYCERDNIYPEDLCVKTPALDGCHDADSMTTAGTDAEGHSFVVVLYRPYKSV